MRRYGVMGAVGFGVLALGAAPAEAVQHSTGTIDGLAVDIWTWTDSAGVTQRTVIKREGQGNPGHGGYATHLSYRNGGARVDIPADPGRDGGFGYFVSHERYRRFAGGAVDTIASRIFHKDDSPLGRGFPATLSFPTVPAGAGAERVTIQYGHYGTVQPVPIDPNTGADATPLPNKAAAFAYYSLPAAVTWVFQDGKDYPRLDVSVSLAAVIPPGGTVPTADLVSFDIRAPYGVMLFANGRSATVGSVIWGDRQFQFLPTVRPVTRNSAWSWAAPNRGARYHAIFSGGVEFGLFEPRPLAATQITDGYADERGFTSALYAAAGGVSESSCPGGAAQSLPADGTWPYQSLQYSLPCDAFGAPTSFTKIAWGSAAYYGHSLGSVYNGHKAFPLAGFPASHVVRYSVCLVTGIGSAGASRTRAAAQSLASVTPATNCATVAAP